MPSVLSYSNLIRSIAIDEKKHLSSFEGNDYMIENVKSSFKEQGFQVVSDFNYGQDEVDIVAYIDNCLFIFECKNPYHPTNNFELRNTFDHLIKGFSQLRKIKNILSDSSRLKNFLNQLSFNKCNPESIYYGVINANRALSNLTDGEFKVFHANELINFIETGIIKFKDKDYRCWENEDFDCQDLIDFLNGKVSSDIYNSMKEYSYGYKFRSKNLIIETCAIDDDKLEEIINSSYTKLTN